MDDGRFQWKKAFSRDSPAENSVTDRVHISPNWQCSWDPASDSTKQFMAIVPEILSPQCGELAAFVFSFRFFFSIMCTGWTSRPILTCQVSNDAVSHKEVLLGMTMATNFSKGSVSTESPKIPPIGLAGIWKKKRMTVFGHICTKNQLTNIK
jgi:hypothetical protein